MTTNAETFQNREELVQFIEDRASDAIQRATQFAMGGTPNQPARTPYVTTGPVGQDSAGYSVLKAAGLASGCIPPEQAKEELNVDRQLREAYAEAGFANRVGSSLLVPFSSAHMPEFGSRGQRLQDEVRQKLAASVSGYDPDEAAWMQKRVQTKAIQVGSDTAGGSLLPNAALGELFDHQRSLEVFAAAGAREVPLPPSGKIDFPRLTAGATAYWVGEGAEITGTQATTSKLALVAKKLGVLVQLNNDFLRFVTPTGEALLRSDMARAAAERADRSMIDGSGSTQIKGLISYTGGTGINTYSAFVPGDDGDTLSPRDLGDMEAVLPDEALNNVTLVVRKEMLAWMAARRLDQIADADAKGPPLFNVSRTPTGVTVNGFRTVRSSQIPNNRSKGENEELTLILMGNFQDWIIARLGVMEFATQGVEFRNDQTLLRGIQHIDAGPRNTKSFVVMDQLLSS